MEFRGQQGTSFEEAEHRYAELKRRYDAGQINDEQFDAERQRLLVVDDEGKWWAKSGENGKWHYHDGEAWIEATPPVYHRQVGSEDSPEQPRHKPATQLADEDTNGLVLSLEVLCAVLAVGLIATLAYSLTGEGTTGGTDPRADSTPAASVVPPNAPPESVPQQGKPGDSGSPSSSSLPGSSVDGEQDTSSPAEVAAAQAVEDFYTSAAEGDYGRTSELLTTSARRRYFPSGNFEKAFGTLKSIRFTEGPTAEVSGDTATVTGTTIAEHTDRTEQNRGTWTLINERGQWKLDDWDVQLEQYL